jgi:hypothetical protein
MVYQSTVIEQDIDRAIYMMEWITRGNKWLKFGFTYLLSVNTHWCGVNDLWCWHMRVAAIAYQHRWISGMEKYTDHIHKHKHQRLHLSYTIQYINYDDLLDINNFPIPSHFTNIIIFKEQNIKQVANVVTLIISNEILCNIATNTWSTVTWSKPWIVECKTSLY